MIILFHIKLDKFYYIVVMNQSKVMCYDSFFCSDKNELLLASQKGVTTKSDIITVVVKKKLQILSQKSRFLKENANNKYRNLSEEEK